MGSNTTVDFIFTPYIQVDPLGGSSFKNHSICMSSLFTDDKLLEYLEDYCHRPYVFTGLVHCWNKFFPSACQDHQIFFDEDLNQLEDVNFVFRYLHFAEKKEFINVAGVYHESTVSEQI